MNENKKGNSLLYLLIKKRYILVLLIFIIITITYIGSNNNGFVFADIITSLGFICVLFITIVSNKGHYM